MAGPVNASDQAARDDAHLQSLGIKPELRRTLGFLSNFAIAFAFISVSTGSFGNFGVGIALGGPAMFWTWFVICGGQLLVALVFAELASHYPVAGSVYQWSKRLSNRGLGWFTGWFYFWAQVVTVSAVAVIVVVRGRAVSRRRPAWRPTRRRSHSSTRRTRRLHHRCSSFVAIGALVITTIINAYGVRLMSILNNIGVATEILGMLVFGVVLLIFANVQPPSVLTDVRTAPRPPRTATSRPRSCSGCSWPCSSSTASTRPGRTARRPSTPVGRHPAASCRRSSCRSSSALIFIPAVILASPDINATMAEGAGRRLSDRDHHQRRPSRRRSSFGISFGELYLVVILASVFVCTMAIQGAASRLMFSMARDRHLPARRLAGPRQPAFQTPANATVTVGVIAALPILVVGPLAAISLSIAATGLIYVSYFLCNAGVMRARTKGWPHARPGSASAAGASSINIVALIWGGADDHQHRPLERPGPVRRLRRRRARLYWNPFINTFIKPFGQEIAGCRPGRLFETLIGLIVIFGAIYYFAAVRRQAPDVEGADTDRRGGDRLARTRHARRRGERSPRRRRVRAPDGETGDERRARRDRSGPRRAP